MITSKYSLFISLIIILFYVRLFADGTSDYSKALSLIKEGEIDKAKSLLLQIAEKESGDIGDVSLDLASAIDISSNDAIGLYVYGSSLLKMTNNDYIGAIDILKRTDFQGQLKEYGFEAIGICYQKLMMWEEALDTARTLYKIAGEDRKPWYLFNQWQIYKMMGEDKRAKEIYRQLKDTYPEFTISEINK